MALHEESVTDHRLARFMTHNLDIPVNADIPTIDVIFVDQSDAGTCAVRSCSG